MFLQLNNNQLESPFNKDNNLTFRSEKIDVDISKFVTFDQLFAILPHITSRDPNTQSPGDKSLSTVSQYDKQCLGPSEPSLTDLGHTLQNIGNNVVDIYREFTVVNAVRDRRVDLLNIPDYNNWPNADTIVSSNIRRAVDVGNGEILIESVDNCVALHSPTEFVILEKFSSLEEAFCWYFHQNKRPLMPPSYICLNTGEMGDHEKLSSFNRLICEYDSRLDERLHNMFDTLESKLNESNTNKLSMLSSNINDIHARLEPLAQLQSTYTTLEDRIVHQLLNKSAEMFDFIKSSLNQLTQSSNLHADVQTNSLNLMISNILNELNTTLRSTELKRESEFNAINFRLNLMQQDIKQLQASSSVKEKLSESETNILGNMNTNHMSSCFSHLSNMMDEKISVLSHELSTQLGHISERLYNQQQQLDRAYKQYTIETCSSAVNIIPETSKSEEPQILSNRYYTPLALSSASTVEIQPNRGENNNKDRSHVSKNILRKDVMHSRKEKRDERNNDKPPDQNLVPVSLSPDSINENEVVKAIIDSTSPEDLKSKLTVLGVRWHQAPNKGSAAGLSTKAPKEMSIVNWLIISNQWPPIAKYHCVHVGCMSNFASPQALTKHNREVHSTQGSPHHLEMFERMCCFEGFWQCSSTDKCITIRDTRKDKLSPCPIPECEYTSSSYMNLLKHLTEKHNIKQTDYGWFWDTLKRYCTHLRKSPTFANILHSNEVRMCNRCVFISEDTKAIRIHTSSKHPTNIASDRGWTPEKFHLSPLFQPSDIEKDNAKNILSPRTDIHINPDPQVSPSPQTAVIRTEPTPSTTISTPPSSLTTNKKLSNATKWKNMLAKDHIPIPFLNMNRRKKIKEGVIQCMRNDVLPLLKDYLPTTNSNTEWICFDGAISRAIFLIRKTIIKALCLKDQVRTRTNGCVYKSRSHKTSDNSARSGQANQITIEKNCQELISVLTSMTKVDSSKSDQTRANAMSNLEQKATALARRLPHKLRKQTLGEGLIEDIRNLIAEPDHTRRQARIEWISCRFKAYCNKYRNSTKGRDMIQIQKQYTENPQKTYQWHTSDPVVECPIAVQAMADYWESKWSHKAFKHTYSNEDLALFSSNEGGTQEEIQVALETRTDEIRIHENIEEVRMKKLWTLPRRIQENGAQAMMDTLTDNEAILETISRADNSSAAGPDGLSYSVWKCCSKESSEMLSLIIKGMMMCDKSPSVWKMAKTVMIFKKGDADKPSNWRPITITNSLYRLFACHVNNSIHINDRQQRMFSESQKGFIKGTAGCTEHACSINEAIACACRERRSIYTLSIDFADAFGSTDYKLALKNMSDVGIPNSITQLIRSTYKDNFTRIFINGSTSKSIKITNGVKQGCPLSPTLFNFAIDPLLSCLNETMKSEGFTFTYGNTNFSINNQCYADDLILLSSSKEGLEKMIKVVEMFSQHSNLVPNSAKCLYSGSEIIDGITAEPREPIEVLQQQLKAIPLSESLKYLGVKVSSRRSSRTQGIVQSYTEKIKRLRAMGLKTNQLIHAIKTFVLSTLDYQIMNGECNFEELTAIDKAIRKMINDSVKSSAMPVDFFYTPWRVGGLGLVSLKDRYHILHLNAFAIMQNSLSSTTQALIKYSDQSEVKIRGFNTNLRDNQIPQSTLWRVTNPREQKAKHSGRQCIASKAMKAAQALDMDIYALPDKSISIVDLKTGKSKSCNGKNFVYELTQLIRARYTTRLCKLKLRGHSIHSFSESEISNFYMGNFKAPTSQNLMAFALKTRVNTLFTREIMAKRDKNISPFCPLCLHKGKQFVDSLSHRLNGCKQAFKPMTRRHNEVVEIMCKAIMSERSANIPTIHRSCTIKINNAKLPDNVKNLRPDIWLEDKDELTIIEVSIPYPTMLQRNGEDISSLKFVENCKREKYTALVEACKTMLNKRVTFHTIIISSLGSITKATVQSIQDIIRSKNKTKGQLWAKRMTMAAIRGSYSLFYNKTQDEMRHVTAIDLIRSESLNETENLLQEGITQDNEDNILISDMYTTFEGTSLTNTQSDHESPSSISDILDL